MTTKINLPSSISSYPTAFVVAYVFATIDSKEYSWAITRSEFDSLPWAITDTSDGSDNSRDYATRFEFAILNAIRSLHHIRIVKPSIYLVDPPIDFDMNWLHGYEFTILEIDPQGEITAKDVNLPTLYVEDEDDSDDSDDSDAPVAAQATPKQIAGMFAKTGSIKAKFMALCEDLGITLLYGSEWSQDSSDNSITVVSLKTLYDLNCAFHELAHCTLGHKVNSVTNEVQADLWSDAVMSLVYKKSYLFGMRKYDNAAYAGTYGNALPTIESITAFCNQHDIHIDADDIEYMRVFVGIVFPSEVAPTIEITTLGEITESDVNFTDSEWEITPTPDGSNSGNTPDGHTTLKSAVSSHFNAATAAKSLQAYYTAAHRKLAKCNTCTLDICESVVTITRLANGTFEVSVQSQPVAPVSEMPVSDWHTIIDEIAISDFNLIDSSEWADLISEAEMRFDAELEIERDEMAIDDYDAEQAIERKNSLPVPRFELLATKQPAKAKRAGRAKFVQMTGMLFDTPKVSTTDLIARRAAQRKDLGDRMPPAPLFRGI